MSGIKPQETSIVALVDNKERLINWSISEIISYLIVAQKSTEYNRHRPQI